MCSQEKVVHPHIIKFSATFLLFGKILKKFYVHEILGIKLTGNSRIQDSIAEGISPCGTLDSHFSSFTHNFKVMLKRFIENVFFLRSRRVYLSFYAIDSVLTSSRLYFYAYKIFNLFFFLDLRAYSFTCGWWLLRGD